MYNNKYLIEQFVSNGINSRFINCLKLYLSKTNDNLFSESYCHIVLNNIDNLLELLEKINTSN
jgi:hypothetical protein